MKEVLDVWHPYAWVPSARMLGNFALGPDDILEGGLLVQCAPTISEPIADVTTWTRIS